MWNITQAATAMIEIIDKDTVKITTEKIVDLRPLKKRLIDIEEELKAVEKEPEEITIDNEEKHRTITSLKEEKININNELKLYG